MGNNITLQVGVKVLLKNKEGKYLLLRRSLDKYPDIKGRWDIVGGRINPGTDLVSNLEREVEEETGLKLLNRPKLVAAQDIILNAERHVVRLTYIGESEGDVQLDASENDAYNWYTLGELKALEDIDMYFRQLLDDGALAL